MDTISSLYKTYISAMEKWINELNEVLSTMDSMEERIEYVLRFVQQSCSLDLSDYFSKIFTLDLLVLNEDRHLNNLAIIFNGDTFIPAPIFNQGISLLTTIKSIFIEILLFQASSNIHLVIN